MFFLEWERASTTPTESTTASKVVPERANPFSLFLHLAEKWWQCLVTWASFHRPLNKIMVLTLLTFSTRVSLLFPGDKRKLVLLQRCYLPYRTVLLGGHSFGQVLCPCCRIGEGVRATGRWGQAEHHHCKVKGAQRTCLDAAIDPGSTL